MHRSNFVLFFNGVEYKSKFMLKKEKTSFLLHIPKKTFISSFF